VPIILALLAALGAAYIWSLRLRGAAEATR
jgi:hypothetical protein